jgi:hypothetical protein
MDVCVCVCRYLADGCNSVRGEMTMSSPMDTRKSVWKEGKNSVIIYTFSCFARIKRITHSLGWKLQIVCIPRTRQYASTFDFNLRRGGCCLRSYVSLEFSLKIWQFLCKFHICASWEHNFYGMERYPMNIWTHHHHSKGFLLAYLNPNFLLDNFFLYFFHIFVHFSA